MATDTYVVTVESVGDFTVKRRTIGIQLAIARELNQLTGGQSMRDLSDWFLDYCGVIAEARALLAETPEGWVLEDRLIYDFPSVRAVMVAVMEREHSFRQTAGGDQKGGSPTGEESSVVVSGSVSPAAE